MLIQVCGIALIGLVSYIIIKEVKPSFAPLISVSTACLILIFILRGAGELFSSFNLKMAELNIKSELFYYLIKIIGISFIIEFIVDISEDLGSKVIASKVKLAGKILLASISLPLLFDLIDLLMSFV